MHTAHNIYCLNGETPETIMSGETLDTSQFCELKWYEWIMFRDSAVLFTEDKIALGRYLRPIIDIGPDMIVKILKSNGEMMHQLTYRYLLSEDLESTEQQTARQDFYESVSIKCGPGATVEDWDKLGAVETPDYYLYEEYIMEGT